MAEGQQVDSTLLCAVSVDQRMHVGIGKWVLTSEAGDGPQTAILLLLIHSGSANSRMKFKL